MANVRNTQKSADELFEQFLKFEKLGLRKEAKKVVTALVEDVCDDAAKIAWTKSNLHRLPRNKNSRIRHEIFKEIVFPSLKAAFDCGDAESSYLFGIYSQNLYSDSDLFDQMGQRTDLDFFKRAFETVPSSEQYESAYLGALLNFLQYLFHEWPTGILINHTKWKEGLEKLKNDISLAQSLDRKKKHSECLVQWLEYIEEYEKRLTSKKCW